MVFCDCLDLRRLNNNDSNDFVYTLFCCQFIIVLIVVNDVGPTYCHLLNVNLTVSNSQPCIDFLNL